MHYTQTSVYYKECYKLYYLDKVAINNMLLTHITQSSLKKTLSGNVTGSPQHCTNLSGVTGDFPQNSTNM